MTQQTRHAIYHINYHFVWCPKYRRAVLTGAVSDRLTELIPQKVEELGGEILELVLRPDHVHLFAAFPPTLAPNQIMHRIKGFTSHQLRKEFPCGLELDRDVNAARNILASALKEAA